MFRGNCSAINFVIRRNTINTLRLEPSDHNVLSQDVACLNFLDVSRNFNDYDDYFSTFFAVYEKKLVILNLALILGSTSFEIMENFKGTNFF